MTCYRQRLLLAWMYVFGIQNAFKKATIIQLANPPS